MFKTYLETIENLLENLLEREQEKLNAASRMLADVLRQDGMIYIFGCGHSHMLAEEGFYRAGGLGAVYPMLQSDLMLHEGAVKSSSLERKSELAAEILARYPVTERDAVLVFSNSGINGLPVEMARLATQTGAATIGISSGAYAEEASRHPMGLHLSDAVTLSLDSGAPHGDATLPIAGTDAVMGPVSTVVGAFILNGLLASAAQAASDAGEQPAIYVSGNIAGGREMNEAVIARYRHRIRSM